MELYLLRHGVAEDRAPDGTDGGRRLTAEGVEKLEAAGAGLRRLRVQPEVILTSPLVRTRQTAEIVGGLLGVEPAVAEELAPGCGARELLALLGERARAGGGLAGSVMVVGHEPDMSSIIGALTGGRVEMKKGALALVRLAGLREGGGTLVWLVPPRGLR